METVIEYKHLADRPETLTADWIRDAYAKLVSRSEAAASGADWVELVGAWNSLKSYVGSERARRSYKFSKNMGDAAVEAAEREVREQFMPLAEAGNAKMAQALLGCDYKDAISERFGAQLLTVLEVAKGPLADVNSDLRIKAGHLSSSYDKLVAGAEVEVQGETMTLAAARSKVGSPDAETRRAGYTAFYGWFLANRDQLAGIFDEQVKVRDEMGRNLGHKNFVPLGYDGMGRTAYGPEQVGQFHAAVLKHAVPLFKRQAAAHAKALGTETLRPWDSGFYPGRSLGVDACEPIGEQLDKAGRMFKRLSPRLSAHFERMRSEGLIDLENRKGKRSGAFCTSFSDEGRVAIMCNSTGSEGDIGTLAHEMGHAFQGWESQAIESVDLQWPTSDGAEVHSMGMEYMSLDYLDEFFNDEDRANFTRARWSRGIGLLCYVCVVDAFQQWVYENPNATMDDRDLEWMRLAAKYLPGVDYSGEAAVFAHTRWYAQMHIFRYPFYYIDYAIAETGAMQLALMNAKDHDGCLETYINLCKLGGTKDVINLFKSAGLRPPFDADSMGALMDHASTLI